MAIIKIGSKAGLVFHLSDNTGLTKVPVTPDGDSGSLTRFQRFHMQSSKKSSLWLVGLIPIFLFSTLGGGGPGQRSQDISAQGAQGQPCWHLKRGYRTLYICWSILFQGVCVCGILSLLQSSGFSRILTPSLVLPNRSLKASVSSERRAGS